MGIVRPRGQGRSFSGNTLTRQTPCTPRFKDGEILGSVCSKVHERGFSDCGTQSPVMSMWGGHFNREPSDTDLLSWTSRGVTRYPILNYWINQRTSDFRSTDISPTGSCPLLRTTRHSSC